MSISDWLIFDRSSIRRAALIELSGAASGLAHDVFEYGHAAGLAKAPGQTFDSGFDERLALGLREFLVAYGKFRAAHYSFRRVGGFYSSRTYRRAHQLAEGALDAIAATRGIAPPDESIAMDAWKRIKRHRDDLLEVAGL